MTSPTWRSFVSAALFVALTSGVSAPAAAMHPNHPVTFGPERSVQSGSENIDHIDLFSGSLAVRLPVGPFVLSSTSNVWIYQVDEQTGEITARPDWERTGGLGWHLGWGELYSPSYSLNTTGKWLYVDEAGASHRFYDDLHRDDGDDGDTNNRVFYSRDGSYLRLRLSNDWCHAYIEHPDGSTRKLTGSCGPQTAYRLVSTWSAFASETDPDMTVTYEVDPNDPTRTEDTLRKVTNRYGQTHKVYLSDKMNGDPQDPIHGVRRIVTRVELESFGGQTAVYDFTYRQIHVDVSCKDDSGATRIEAPHLERIDLPSGASYSMEDGGQLLYENQCRVIDGHLVDDLPGVLTGINLPTGGKIRWQYQRYEFPPGDNSSVFNTSAGVKTRTLLERDLAGGPDVELGVWTYKSTNIPPMDTQIPGEPTHPEKHTEVVYPTGECSKHFFDAIYWVDPVNSSGAPWGWERGLPFVLSEESGGKYLSSQIYEGHDGNGSCDPATKLRSTYLRYRHDTTPGNGSEPQSVWYDTNRAVEASRTVFHDDGDWYVDTELSDFDGLGNFRRSVTTSNFWGSEQRDSTTDYNRSSGTYPGTYVALPISEPWILGVYDSVEVNEPGAVGVQTTRSELSFEDATGFLTCTRTLASGTSRSAADLVTVRTRDALGNELDTKLYGGDLQALDASSGDPCGTLPSEPVYWTSYEYDPLSGARTKAWPRHPDGTFGSFPTLDVDVEPRTGIEIRSRDTAGFEVVSDYDAAGRLISTTPQSGAVITYAYANATPTSRATVTTSFLPAGGGAPLTQSEMISDDFGRPWLERVKLPGEVWSERETLYNARGWVESVSEWGDLSKTTRNLSFDPLGRPTVIRPPDGAAHDVTYSYRGDRVVTETSKIALAGGEGAVSKTLIYDGFGQLRRVWEYSGAHPSRPESTTYSYDVAGQLTKVEAGEQTRSFTYDGRGFLLAATHPEKGVNGNGSVTHGEYDAGGLAHNRTDGPHDLGFNYDFMGRLVQVQDRNQSNRLVLEQVWDGASAFGMGKLQSARRFNWIDLPWNSQGAEAVTVRQNFVYNGLGGAVSRKTTRILWSSPNVRFRQDFVYDELGNLERFTYPYCDQPSACRNAGPGSSQQLTFTYDQGRLTGVPGWIDQVTYHPSGLWQRFTHSNGVADNQDVGSNFTRRAQRTYTTGVTPAFDSGVMTYDGSGNLMAQGLDVFAYDKVNRLVDASFQNGNYLQGFDYDRYGNITSVTGDTTGMYVPPVDPATNRLTGTTYDAAGNMLTAPAPNPPDPILYNTDNLVVSEAGMLYIYDAFGERVASLANVPQEAVTFHVRDLGHRLVSNIRKDGGVWTRERDYIFAGDRLIGRSSPGQLDHHFHLDRLGSVRLATLENGQFVSENLFMPYGERFGSGSQSDSLLFAEPHERDFSTDADYMHARHYWWKLGRFHSPDPILGTPDEPQSWNRYAYVMGNPMNATDPTGMFARQEVDGEESGPPAANPSFWGLVPVGGSSGGVFYRGPGTSVIRRTTTHGDFTYSINGVPQGLFGMTTVTEQCVAGACARIWGTIGGWEGIRQAAEWLGTASAGPAASLTARNLFAQAKRLRKESFRLMILAIKKKPVWTRAKDKLAEAKAITKNAWFNRVAGWVGNGALLANSAAVGYSAGADGAIQDIVGQSVRDDQQIANVRFLQELAKRQAELIRYRNTGYF